VPMPRLIEISVAPVTDQLSWADWPRSMDDGSALNDATTGFPAVGVVMPPPVPELFGGGGGGGITTFLPHAVAKIAITAINEKLVSLEILTCEKVVIIAR
jgi:hypothetical protein